MIWNHSMPDKYKTHNYKKYEFSDFYTAQYMIEAVHAIIAELNLREDIEARWVDVLLKMVMGLKKARGEELVILQIN